jgi:hypothetical protein
MANYRAIANGNFNNLAIWQDDSLGYFFTSSILPGSSDDVFTNNFTVNVNTSFEVSSLRNTAFTPPTNLGAMSIPQMSSNTTPSGAAAASSVQSGNAAWQAFDRNTGTFWQSTTNSGWLSYNFPTGRIIKRYGFFSHSSNNNNPRTWTFEGSNNGSTWVVLDTQTNFVTGVSTFFSFDISANTTSYTYYRINITTTQGGVGNAIVIPELEMSEITNLYGGIVAGGSFNFNSGSISGSATGTPSLAGTTNLVTVTASTGSVLITLEGSITLAGTAAPLINHSGNCNLIISSSSNIPGGGTPNNITIGKTGLGNLTINANLVANTSVASAFILNATAGSLTINGNVVGNSNTGASSHAINQTGGTLTVNGNITGASANSTTYGINFSGLAVTVNGTVTGGLAGRAILTTSPVTTVNGTVTGGTAAAISSTTANQINVSGSVVASANANAITSTNASGIVILNGNITNNAGRQAIYCQNLFLSDTGTTQAQFFTSGSQDRTLYSANTFPNLPSSSIVRSTTLYGPGNELSGSIIMPDPANVRYGVPTDNTTGSALLSAQSLFDEIVTSTNPVAVRLRKSSTTDTFGNMLTAFKK